MSETSKAVVVLGMHRTGTSLTMAAVEALGVDVGTCLLPPGPDNETGYWEDEAIIGLNERLLATLGKTWYSLAPITDDEWAGQGVADLRCEAVALLRHRFPESDIWGFKDPRCTRLWPFWRRVLSDMEVPVKYVVTYRHPDSVAASLAYRNQFTPVRSYFLWLAHYVPFLDQLLAESSIFIDYDRLIDQPIEIVDRLAAFVHGPDWLAQQSRPCPVDEFLDRTLQCRLRHARFEAGEVAPEAPALVGEMLTLLDRLGKGGNDGAGEREAVALREQYQSYVMLLRQLDDSQSEADRLGKRVREEEPIRDKIEKIGLYHADTNRKMEQIDVRHAAMEKHVEALSGELELAISKGDILLERWQRQEELVSGTREVAETLGGKLESQQSAISGMQEIVGVFTGKLESQQEILSGIRDITQIVAGRVEDVQEKVVVQLDEFYRVLKKELGQEETSRNSQLIRQLSEAHEQIESIYISTSWRLTRPLRALKKFMLRMSKR